MKAFKDKVRDHRGQLGLNQKQLAEKAGIGFRTIVTYESGERFPQAAQLYKLAKALGVSTEYLKDDNIDDPTYGLDRMEYVEEMRKREGRKESLDLEKMLQQNQALFAGGSVSEEAKDAYFQALMKAYLECKESARQTFGRKKSDASDQ
ncbi:MAG: helix-turn-helix domain-containing protein [Lachnospiraceae bacterium]|nr:helix-turn-helix domain-containing protein [Lachnospiraceae bacterium]